MRTSKNQTKKAPPLIVCPKCGFHGERGARLGGAVPFRYLEDIICYRDVPTNLVDANGKLDVLDVMYESGEGYDGGENGRLECRDCGHEFPCPVPLPW